MIWKEHERTTWKLEQARMALAECVLGHDYDQAQSCARYIIDLIDRLRTEESTQSQEVVQ